MFTTASLTKVAEIIKILNLTQSALFVVRRVTLPEISGTHHLYHPLLILPTTYKDTGGARYTLQGIIVATRYPTDRDMPPT